MNWYLNDIIDADTLAFAEMVCFEETGLVVYLPYDKELDSEIISELANQDIYSYLNYMLDNVKQR